MMSLFELARKGGAAKAAIYARKCFERGAGWVEWEPMWEHWEFFVVRRIKEDNFQQKFALGFESSGAPSKGSAPSGHVVERGAAPQVAPQAAAIQTPPTRQTAPAAETPGPPSVPPSAQASAATETARAPA